MTKFNPVDGITNQSENTLIQSCIRILLINRFNEKVSIETKWKVEVILDMNAQCGESIGPTYKNPLRSPANLFPIWRLQLSFRRF